MPVTSSHRVRNQRYLENTSRPIIADTHPNLSKHQYTKEIQRGGYDAEAHPIPTIHPSESPIPTGISEDWGGSRLFSRLSH